MQKICNIKIPLVSGGAIINLFEELLQTKVNDFLNDGREICVKNLPKYVSEDRLRDFVSQKEVTDAKLMRTA
ncbi:hypothetical protein DKX38_000572 [Salix brachista]|uniref:Uncharacterized protein n=1 Tax=Salix brachista TaxID=2182728 RepID=A0A5N5P2P4_9ROSI|nr:hypothetical protein DKX38_000572 [Salix brachista]